MTAAPVKLSPVDVRKAIPLLRRHETLARREPPAPPPWPDLRSDGVRPRMLAALAIVRQGLPADQVADRVRRLAVNPDAVAIRVREYGLAMIRRATDAQLEVIADYPSPALIAAMSDPEAVLAIMADPVVSARVAAHQAANLPDGPVIGHRACAAPPDWRSALGRPLRRGE